MHDSARCSFRWQSIVLVALVSVVLFIRSLELRLPHFTRDFNEDEIHHNYDILTADGIRELRVKITAQRQPILEYVLRQVFWFPLFGSQERALRIPSLLYGTANALAAFVIAFFYFQKKQFTLKTACFFSLLMALWVIYNPTEIHYSAEARHYSFVSTASLLWFAAYILQGNLRSPMVVFATILYANSHFFSYAVIAFAFLIDSIPPFRTRNWKIVITNFGLLTIILGGTALINYPAFSELIFHRLAPPAHGGYQRLLDGLGVWYGFFNYLSLPFHFLVVMGMLLLSWRHPQIRKVLAIGFILLPFVFIYKSFTDAYRFSVRYYTPFFGFGWVALLLAMEVVFNQSGMLLKRHVTGANYQRLVAYAMVIGIAILGFSLNDFLLNSIREADRITKPPRNFSTFYRIYDELKKTQVPLFILHNHCWADDIPHLQLRYIVPPYEKGFEIYDANGCHSRLSSVRGPLQTFLKLNPNGVVVLDQKQKDCSTYPSPSGPWKAVVTRVSSVSNCVWTISGSNGVNEIASIAKAVRFDGPQTMFQ